MLGLTADSRKVERGMLFAALPGAKANGAGASSPMRWPAAPSPCSPTASAELPAGLAVPVLRAHEPRAALARMAARFYADQPAVAVAVTGTSGKTSVAEFTRQIFAALGHRAASLGTIGLVKPDGAVYGSLTTPDPVSLHRTLAGLAAEGVTHLAFEASSHGLDQHRLDGVRLTAAAFTNLGHDHLDYHPTVEAYLAAKLRLFSELVEPGRRPSSDAEDPRGRGHRGRAPPRAARSSGRQQPGARTCGSQSSRAMVSSQRLRIEHEGAHHEVVLPLLGAYQAANALVAAGLAIAAGEEAARVLPLLARLKGVKGRLEIVGEAAAASRSSTMRTSPRRWPPRSTRCAPSRPAG